MRRVVSRTVFLLLLFCIVASCTGSGCSGCASCGVRPLSGGFPPDLHVPSAGAVRLTRPGLDFLQQNLASLASRTLGTGLLSFDIPKTTSSGFSVCPNKATPGDCVVDIDLGKAALALTAVAPNRLRLSGSVPIRLKSLPVAYQTPFGLLQGWIVVGQSPCSERGSDSFLYSSFPITIDLPLTRETTAPRSDYMRIDTDNMTVDITLTAADLQICSNCGVAAAYCDAALKVIRDLVFAPLRDAINANVHAAVASQLCMAPTAGVASPCPTGSQVSTDGTKCVYTSVTSTPSKCVPMMLGMDGILDLGALVGTGTNGGLDVLLAAGADARVSGAGITFPLLGGALQHEASDCVSLAPNAVPSEPALPVDLLQDTPTGWTLSTTPHVGFGLSRLFLNYAATSLYNGGLFCFSLSTEQSSQLSTGLLSLLAPSVNALKQQPLETKAAPMAIQARPTNPPRLTLGAGTRGNSLLHLQFDGFAFDFYVWSTDRYIRIFTFTANMGVPIDLVTGKTPGGTGIFPSLGDLTLTGGQVTHADLLGEDPSTLAFGLQLVFSSAIGQVLGGALPALNPSAGLASMGLELTVPEGGMRKVGAGQDEFLAFYGTLKLSALAAPVEVQTKAVLLDKTVVPEAMTLATANRDKLPQLLVHLDADTAPVEYSWWIDQGTRSPWTQDTDLVLRRDVLFLQGKHTLFVTARVVGEPHSEDPTPAQVPFVIDVLPPTVLLEASGPGWVVHAADLVTARSELLARVRYTDATGDVGEWEPWKPLASLSRLEPGNMTSVDLEVRDEEGNVAQVSQSLRGRADATLQPGAGCSMSRGSPGTPWLLAWGIVAIAAVLRRRLGFLAGAVVVAQQACSGNSATIPDEPKVIDSKTGCGLGCNEPCGPANAMGVVGAYLSLARAKNGTLWISAYSDTDFASSRTWGDLVVGTYNTTVQQVQWRTVDGLADPGPPGTCVPNDPKGWRGGAVEPGPNVGLWTNLVLDANDRPLVSYYDLTNRALKFASFDGANWSWSTHTVRQATGSDVGRYAKMILSGGKPVVAFLAMENDGSATTTSKLVLARSNVPVPVSESDWRFEDVAVGTGPVHDDSVSEAYPNAIADYISLAEGPSGLGLVAYDRLHGNLVAYKEDSGWKATILDGETGSRSLGTAKDTGDVGIAASLVITPNGDWHVGYVNGSKEQLVYLRVGATPEVVDDGTMVDGAPFEEAKHVVGDDVTVSVDDTGMVLMYYQDATAGTLRRAVGIPEAGQHRWSRTSVPQAGRFAGFFPRPVPGTSQVANFWRGLDGNKTMSGNISFVSP